MARVQPMSPFSDQFFSGAAELDVAAGSLFALVSALDAMCPGFAEAAEERAAFAVDGLVQPDWSTPLNAGSDVLLFTRVAGG